MYLTGLRHEGRKRKKNAREGDKLYAGCSHYPHGSAGLDWFEENYTGLYDSIVEHETNCQEQYGAQVMGRYRAVTVWKSSQRLFLRWSQEEQQDVVEEFFGDEF